MKAIKLILVTIIQLYASMFGFNSEEKPKEVEAQIVIIQYNVPLSEDYYLYNEYLPMHDTYVWHIPEIQGNQHPASSD